MCHAKGSVQLLDIVQNIYYIYLQKHLCNVGSVIALHIYIYIYIYFGLLNNINNVDLHINENSAKSRQGHWIMSEGMNGQLEITGWSSYQFIFFRRRERLRKFNTTNVCMSCIQQTMISVVSITLLESGLELGVLLAPDFPQL